MQLPIRIVIAGSREFTSYPVLNKFMNDFIKELFEKFKDTPTEISKDDIEVISGAARGADRLGEEWATKHKIPIKRFKPNWTEHGKSAGHIRNTAMAEYASGKSDKKETFGICVVFWDGESRGSLSMIRAAERNGLMTVVRKIRLPKDKETKK